jgi:hypothetical protein
MPLLSHRVTSATAFIIPPVRPWIQAGRSHGMHAALLFR